MSGLGAVLIFCGAGCGALLRWWLGGQLNALHPVVPLGTVAANLVGGLLVGVASAGFGHHTEIPVEWRLLVITGFLGGLTTFSTFSIEVVALIGRHEYAWALLAASLHLLGSLALTGLGILAVHALLGRA